MWNPFRPRRQKSQRPADVRPQLPADVRPQLPADVRPQLPADVVMIGAESLDPDWKEIGAGGFGKVYKTRHLKWGWDVAVKLLGNDDGVFSDADLLHEAALMRRAENQYVMKVRAMFRGCKPGQPFVVLGMVMELMENGSLDSLQKTLNHPLPWPLVFRLANQVALGMNYLHGLTPALFHKDLKPQNILLDNGLNVQITDFGLAKFDNNLTDKRLKGACTPFFAPPDAAKGGADSAYDVYSYAMLLWSILNTGQISDARFTPAMGERPSLEAIRGMQADGLVELVELMERCWSQDKKDRPSFTACAEVTPRLYDMHRHGINLAVCKVQTELAVPPPPAVPPVPAVAAVPEVIPVAAVAAVAAVTPVPPVTPVPAVPQVAAVPPVPAGSTNREDFLKHSCPLSLDPSSMNDELCLSEDNRTVTSPEEDQPSHPDNQDRFAHHPQVLSSDRLPERCYFEVKWSGCLVSVAVCYQDISRKDPCLSGFGADDKSLMLWRNRDAYWMMLDRVKTEVAPGSTCTGAKGVDDNDGGVIGVYVGDTAGAVSFYSVYGNTMSPLHTVQTDAARPLHAGIHVPYTCTAEVRKIW